jgi:hypothetical protein
VQTNQTEGVFTLQTAMQAVAANQWCTDPYFDQTTMLLQADNVANASQNITFIDSGSSGATLTPTSANAPAQGLFTPFSQPNGYWANYFDGTLDYLTIPSNAALNIGTNNFTIEFWINTNNNNYGVFKLVGTGSTSNGPTVTSGLKFAWWKDGSSEILLSTTTAIVPPDILGHLGLILLVFFLFRF